VDCAFWTCGSPATPTKTRAPSSPPSATPAGRCTSARNCGWTWSIPASGRVLFLSYRWLFPGWPGLIIGTVSLSSVVVDYLENAALAAMLRAGPDAMTPEMADAASRWTTMKWSFAALGLVTLVIGLALRFRRSRSGTRGQPSTRS
jgi:hypothetical protein